MKYTVDDYYAAMGVLEVKGMNWTVGLDGETVLEPGKYDTLAWGDIVVLDAPLLCGIEFIVENVTIPLIKCADFIIYSERGSRIYDEEWLNRWLSFEVALASYEVIVIDCQKWGMPEGVYIDDEPHPSPLPSRADFDAANYNCWYYDGVNRLLYVKVYPSSPVEVKLDYRAPPYIPPIELPPKVPEVPKVPVGLIVLALVLVALLVLLYALRRR